MALDQDVNPTDARPRGRSTAVGINLEYRLGIVRDLGVLHGEWLDCGCAEGAYTAGLREFGADSVVGLDVEETRVEEARARTDDPQVSYVHGVGERLPFDDGRFDGVYINEVLEHVADERQTLGEIHRVLRAGGHVVVMSPNRGSVRGPRASARLAQVRPPGAARAVAAGTADEAAPAARNYWPSSSSWSPTPGSRSPRRARCSPSSSSTRGCRAASSCATALAAAPGALARRQPVRRIDVTCSAAEAEPEANSPARLETKPALRQPRSPLAPGPGRFR